MITQKTVGEKLAELDEMTRNEEHCYACDQRVQLNTLEEMTCGHLLCERCSPGRGCRCPSCEEEDYTD